MVTVYTSSGFMSESVPSCRLTGAERDGQDQILPALSGTARIRSYRH